MKKESTPWVSAGSEFDIEEESIAPGGVPVVIEVFRKRREFGVDVKLVDTDSADLWNSSQMECRPFKGGVYTYVVYTCLSRTTR